MIRENGTRFFIGSRSVKIPKEAGKLYVQIVPSPWGKSNGEYKVTVSTGVFGEEGEE